MFCASSRITPPQRTCRQDLDVAMQQRVAGEHDGVARRFALERRAFAPAGAVMHQHRQIRA